MGITSSINESLDNSTVGELAKLTNGKPQNSGDIKDSFLNILVAQLKNQDPTNPMQNSELTSQIAQISTVEGIEKLNKTLGSIVGQMDSNHTMQKVALIGRGIMVSGNDYGNEILVGADEAGNISTTPFGYELDRPADSVKITIKHKSGTVVREMEFNKSDPNSAEFLHAGIHSFVWDGKDANGNHVEEKGAYNFTVSASRQEQDLMVHPLRYAEVNGVVRQENSTKLDLGLVGTANMDEVRQFL
ncbi:flagellar hook assembly protein FlgD [Xenorhabdus sp. DI]|uniref:flagellar hook assembly protein FlgD n=1 Tax=Xenorhabdus doucetiae TaxID=351671 RepID=UPI0019A1A29B|nr:MULTISPECIES: flagellar hook assembly protein FlgD [unclassified Xenorhabdus]MBD2786180.1 flagellar hook assembly protein FlgD [Xenorhabdus sp. 3]MBD2789525.1 flagellar hook assembly protein FlgD [Xenorhabdus sp. DI]